MSWKKNIRKSKRAKGEQYVSTTGETIDAKTFNPIDCCCPLKCSTKIDAARQADLHRQFYALADWSLQTSYLAGQIKVTDVHTRYTKAAQSRRQTTKHYYFSRNGIDTRVCKVFFKQVLAISDGRIARATNKKNDGLVCDQRGKHVPHNKTPETEVQYLKDFIERFPTYTSHYSRAKNPNRSYLCPSLNISIMFDLYQAQCHKEGRKPLNQDKFRKTFNHNFNLSFHPPHKDTCKTCDELNIKLDACDSEEARSQLQARLEIHHRKAESARHSLQADTAASKVPTENLTTLTFDLEKTLPTPVLSSGICYYKRQLWTYNFGIHDMASDTGYMYVWHEGIASRGPDEVASALLCHITNFIKTENLTVYSDCCGGQNRNIKIALLWNYIVQSDQFSVNCVDHKFLESGHTFLPNDQDFGLIEKNKRFNKDIFVPADWIKVIGSAKKHKPFVVTELKTDKIVSMKPLEQRAVNRKKTRWAQSGVAENTLDAL